MRSREQETSGSFIYISCVSDYGVVSPDSVANLLPTIVDEPSMHAAVFPTISLIQASRYRSSQSSQHPAIRPFS